HREGEPDPESTPNLRTRHREDEHRDRHRNPEQRSYQRVSAVGISETSFELGNALGLALLGSLAAVVFRSGGNFKSTLG
ncbi:hypothetical protein, partial [Nocardia cyriacigeorgica]